MKNNKYNSRNTTSAFRRNSALPAHSKGIRLYFLIVFIQMIFVGSVAATDRWVCQECDPLWTNTYGTIEAAILAADPGDTIKIHAEEYPAGSEHIVQYSEHVVIDKQLTITSPSEHVDYGWPVVRISNFDTLNEVVKITLSGAGSEISNLNIWGPVYGGTGYTDCTECDSDPIDCMDQRAGIRIEGDDCSVDNCRIIFCMTGIYVESMGNIISGCQVGDRWWRKTTLDEYVYEEYWTFFHDGDDVFNRGNGFGIVQIEPTWEQQSGELYLDRPITEIVDCTIRSNRYYGLVLTNGSHAHVAHNIIAWNGDQDVIMSQGIPDKTGGILSLFTGAQIQANDNKLQAPTILSNTIYGNKGYQIGIFT
ncbi:right-handed parallel beta-helix repeat-containing protein, partial [bacterium]|nr:right-handed parallel beta-helix repeat-containing protein [bacterium]